MEEEMKDGAVPEQVETENVKCDSCGSNMKFDPESQMLYCEHCGRKESFAVYVQADELAIEDALKTGGASWAEETKFSAARTAAQKSCSTRAKRRRSVLSAGRRRLWNSKSWRGSNPTRCCLSD